MKDTVSVVVTTYNGINYLQEQLDSIREQSRTPDEVIIMDDASDDGTPEFIKRYIDFYHLDTWRLIHNKQNIGWKRNFKWGFDIATGTYVFPCDQDDIWHYNKIEKMIAIMQMNSEINVLASNYRIFFEGKYQRHNSYRKKMLNDSSLTKIDVDPTWCYIKRPGCTFCYRNSFYNSIKDKWDVKYAHDALLWRWGCIYDSLYVVNLELIDFRRHEGNTTSTYAWTKKNRISTLDNYIYFNQIAYDNCIKSEKKQVIQDNLSFLHLRKQVLEQKSIISWFKLASKYADFYYSKKGLFLDLLLSFK